MALTVDNRSTGIRRLVGEVVDRTTTFTGESRCGEALERWSCDDGNYCRWERSLRCNGTTVSRLTADLTRVK